MAPFSRKSYWVCKLTHNDHDGTWPNKVCNGTNYHTNTHCRFCDGARPPWANRTAVKATEANGQETVQSSKGKGKGKGKHLGKGAGKSQRPERLDEAVFKALTQDQRRMYNANILSKTDATQLARTSTKQTAEEPTTTAKGIADAGTIFDEDDMDLKESMIQRDFHVRLSKHFDKLVDPQTNAKVKTAEELLCANLTKGPRASAEATDKAQQVTELQSTVALMPDSTAKTFLLAKITELEEQIATLSPNSDEQARAVTDKAAYSTARAKIEKEHAEKKKLREKKAE